MELTQSYKITISGRIPDNWHADFMGEVVPSISSGRSKTKSDRNGLYPIYGSTGIIGYSDNPDYEGETILIARVGANAGTINIVKGKYCVSDNTLILRIDKKLDSCFVYNYLRHYNLNKLVFGSGQPLITGTQLRQLPLPIPPLPEQQAIATALSDIDSLINSLTKLINKKKSIKLGAMQELLTSREGWTPIILGKKAILKARIGWQGLTTAEYKDSGEIILVTGTDFKNGFIDWENCHYVERERYIQDKNIQLRINDVLVTKDGTIGKVAFVNDLPKHATLNSGVFVIRPISDSFVPEFFYYILLSKVFDQFLNQLCAGSTISHLYQKDFVNFMFSAPTILEEQRRIARLLSDMDGEIKILEHKLDKYKNIKQGMMQELLTGRIRLLGEVAQ